MAPGGREALLCCDGDVLVFRLRQGSPAAPALHVRRMRWDAATRAFVQASAGACPLPGADGGHLGIAGCACVADARTGLSLPHVLLRCDRRGGGTRLLLLCLHRAAALEPRLTLDLDRADGARLLPGPLVLWRGAGAWSAVSPGPGEAVRVPDALRSVLWAGEIRTLGTVLLGADAPHDAGRDTRLCLYALDGKRMLDGAPSVPAAYGAVTCARVCAAKMADGRARLALLALTRRDQLVALRHGAPPRACRLPFRDPCAVQPLDPGDGNRLLVVSFSSRDACAVWEDSFQVAATWENVSSVLVDDFAGTGTDQLLLLFDSSSNSDRLTSFRLTDLGSVNYSSEASDLSADDSREDGQDNRRLVMRPLQGRVRAGLAHSQELQKHLLLKEKLISQSFKALMNVLQDRDDNAPITREANLVPLWGEEESCVPALDTKLSDRVRGPEQPVERVWCRVTDDSLVVGVKPTSSLRASLGDVTVSLLLDGARRPGSQPVTCQNKLVWLSTEPCAAAHLVPNPVGPEAKRVRVSLRGRREGQSVSGKPAQEDGVPLLTAVTPLAPLLALPPSCCVVLLQVRGGKDGDRPEDRYVPCGRVSLSLEDLSSGKYLVTLPKEKPIEHMEDLFALLSTSHKSCFRITSPHYVLNAVQVWLFEHMRCEAIGEFPGTSVCRRPGRLYGTVLSWRQKSPFAGILTVYSRNQAVLFQCLHELMQVLPVNSLFRKLRSEREDLLVSHLASSLEQELVALGALSSVLTEAGVVRSCEGSQRARGRAAADSSDRAGETRPHSRELGREKETLGDRREVGGAFYREIMVQVVARQLTSDTTAQSLAHLYV